MVIEFDFEIYKNGDYDSISATGKSQEYYVIMGREIAL